MKKILILITSLTITSVGLSAPKWQEKMFAAGDADQNSSISQTEFVAVKSATAKKNAKKNGKEFKAEANAKWLAKTFSKSDIDGDGKLSAEEFYTTFSKKKK